MHPNEILVRLTDALSMDEAHLLNLFGLGGIAVAESDVRGMLRDPEQADAVRCTGAQMLGFLDGLIIDRRGPRETPEGQAPATPTEPAEPVRLGNNAVLKKLRIAFELKEEDVLAILAAGGTEMTRRQLGALSRKRGNKHYRKCTDEVLESFLTGLATRK